MDNAKSNFRLIKVLRIFLIIILCALSIILINKQLRKSNIYSYSIDDFTYSDTAYQSPITILNKGSYNLFINCTCDEQIKARIVNSDSVIFEGDLSFSGQDCLIPFVLTDNTDDLHIYLYCSQDNTLINSISIVSDKYINTDAFFCLIILWIISGIIFFILPKYFALTQDEKFAFLMMLICFLFVNIMNYDSVIRFGTDTRFHLLRIEGIRDGICYRQLPVVLFPKAYNGFGEIGALYPNLFIYPLALLRLLGVSILCCYKFAVYVINLFTILFTYISAKKILNNTYGAALVAGLYTLFPYRMYVMGYSSSVLGRGISMAFIPLVFAGIYCIIKNSEKEIKDNKAAILMLVGGICGILNSHLLNFVITIIFLILISIIFWKQLSKRTVIISILISAGLSIVLCSSYISLMLEYYFSGLNLDYLKFDIYDKLFSPIEAITSPWNIAVVFYIVLFLIIAFKNKTKIKKQELFLITISIIFCIMATKIFPWKLLLKNPVLNNAISTFQNAKRFYFITGIAVCLLAGTGIGMLKSLKLQRLFACSLILFAMLCCINPIKEYFGCSPLLDSCSGYLEKDQLEYLPEGTKNSDYVSNVASVSDESAINVITYTKQGCNILLEYTCNKDGVYADFPLFYYKNGQYATDGCTYIDRLMGDKHNLRILLEKSDTMKSLMIGFKVSLIQTVVALINILALLLYFAYIAKHLVFRNFN